MDLYQAIKGRRAIRRYESREIPKELILKLLDAANWAPSGMNQQQWEFVVVRGEKKDRLAEIYGKLVEKNMPAPRDEKQEAFLQFARTLGGAPVAVVFMMDKPESPRAHKMVVESVSASFQNFLLAAFGEGLGTVWMTGPLGDEEGIKQLLGIPSHKELVAVTPLGYPAENPVPPARKDPDLTQKVTWIGFKRHEKDGRMLAILFVNNLHLTYPRYGSFPVFRSPRRPGNDQRFPRRSTCDRSGNIYNPLPYCPAGRTHRA